MRFDAWPKPPSRGRWRFSCFADEVRQGDSHGDPFGPVEEENHLWNMTTAMDNDPFSSICLWNMVIFRSSLKLSDELLLAFHLWDAMGFNRKSDAKLLAIIVWQDESKTFNCCSVLALLKAWKIGERRTWNEAGLCLLRRACVKYVLVWVYLAF